MKIDLCKLLGVEEGEKFKFDGYPTIYFIQNSYLYFICEKNGEHKSYLDINDLVNKEIIKLPQKKEFSQDTLNFFKCTDKKYKWIAKDEDDAVCIFCEKPRKGRNFWCDNGIYNRSYISKAFNQDMFEQILWEDEEPVNIDDYVER